MMLLIIGVIGILLFTNVGKLITYGSLTFIFSVLAFLSTSGILYLVIAFLLTMYWNEGRQ